MKLLILGAPLSGKSTLCKYLRESESDASVLDYDEEILKLNQGSWPQHFSLRLIRSDIQLFDAVMHMPDAIYMTYEQPIRRLQRARNAGFRVAQLVVPYEVLRQRNEDRLLVHPDNDAFRFVNKNLRQQQRSYTAQMIDMRIDGTLPVTTIMRMLV